MKISPNRRRIMLLASAQPLAWLASSLLPRLAQAKPAAPAEAPTVPVEDPIFKATSSNDALKQLQALKPQPGDRILLDVPDVADNNERVTLRVVSMIVPTDQITILVDKAAHPVVAQFNLTPDIEADVSVVVKLPQQSTVRAVIRSGDLFYAVDHEVKLATEPCDDVSLPAAEKKAKVSKGRKA